MKQFLDGNADTVAGNFPKRGISLADNPVLTVKICCVYALHVNDWLYIGSTKSLYDRVFSLSWKWSHKSKLMLGTCSKRFQLALEQVDFSQIVCTVLEVCEEHELEDLESMYCLTARLTLNTRVDGLSRGKHVRHEMPRSYQSWWRTAKPTRGQLPYGKGCGSGRAGRKRCSAFGNVFPDIYEMAYVLSVSVMSVSRWCTDDRYTDFCYID